YKGSYLLRRDAGAEVEFITIMLWDSIDAIRAVAGKDYGIEPTVRHDADLGYIPVVVKDACGFGHRDAAARSIASLEFAGDALLTNAEYILCSVWAHSAPNGWLVVFI